MLLARLHLVVEVGEAREAGEPAADLDERLQAPRVDVLAVAGDVPAAGEHEPRARLGVVEHRLRRAGGVALHAAWDEHDEHAVAARDRASDDLAVVGRAGHDFDAALESGELADALLAADSDHLVPSVQRVLDHLLPELPGRADDADPHDSPGAGSGPTTSAGLGSPGNGRTRARGYSSTWPAQACERDHRKKRG